MKIKQTLKPLKDHGTTNRANQTASMQEAY
jgi:hypothetical protein